MFSNVKKLLFVLVIVCCALSFISLLDPRAPARPWPALLRRGQEHLQARGEAVAQDVQGERPHLPGQEVQQEGLLCPLPRSDLGPGATGLQVHPVQDTDTQEVSQTAEVITGSVQLCTLVLYTAGFPVMRPSLTIRQRASDTRKTRATTRVGTTQTQMQAELTEKCTCAIIVKMLTRLNINIHSFATLLK